MTVFAHAIFNTVHIFPHDGRRTVHHTIEMIDPRAAHAQSHQAGTMLSPTGGDGPWSKVWSPRPCRASAKTPFPCSRRNKPYHRGGVTVLYGYLSLGLYHHAQSFPLPRRRRIPDIVVRYLANFPGLSKNTGSDKSVGAFGAFMAMGF